MTRAALRLRPLALVTAFGLITLTLSSLAAAKPPEAKPARLDTAARAGLDPARLAHITPRMQELADAQRIAGAVTLVAPDLKALEF